MVGRTLVLAGLGTLLALPAAAQLTDLQPGRNFTSDNSAQFGTGRSENIDLGDCDNDGDLDVIVANGGDAAPQANRIYVNQGGLQAGTPGTFADETGVRFAGMPNDTSRDCEFVDIDGDGDLDIHISNRGAAAGSPPAGEPNRFHQNQGGFQLGTVGHYVEITDTAFGQLVDVPLVDQVLGGNQGPFRDWSCDCDFADLDDDGDLDLFHGSYGPGFDGARSSRVFLNDGAGVFDELWPWANPAADIRTHTVDMDLADLDGDFDIDIAMSSRDSQARIYTNNTYGPLGAELFRDITQPALIDTGAVKIGAMNNYEVEIGDADGDGDFDLWMVNYNGITDRLLENRGLVGGLLRFQQQNAWIVGDPVNDEQEADFGDYDGDGDLDVYVANFSGTNWIYQSGLAQGLDPATQGIFHRTGGGGSLAAGFPETPAAANIASSLDADLGDIDGDGDLDVVVCNDGNGNNRLYGNVLGVPDVHAPGFAAVTTVGTPPAGEQVVIHAAVRDNAPYYLHTYYPARLVYSVDGGAPVTVPMAAQGGQQFRGVIPAQVGTVAYHVEVDDLAGNTGVSATLRYVQGAPDPSFYLRAG
jgi:hypothetical protein